MRDLVIYGAGSVGKLVVEIVHDINKINEYWSIIGFLDSDATRHGKNFLGLPILGNETWLKNRSVHVVLAISSARSKYQTLRALSSYAPSFATLIHPMTWIGSRVKIGEGSLIYPGVQIDPDVHIGAHCSINKLATVGHDSRISDFSTLAPGVKIGGFSNIGLGAEFGINSSCIQSLKIGDWAIIGAGACVVKNIPNESVAVGVPAKVIKRSSKPF